MSTNLGATTTHPFLWIYIPTPTALSCNSDIRLPLPFPVLQAPRAGLTSVRGDPGPVDVQPQLSQPLDHFHQSARPVCAGDGDEGAFWVADIADLDSRGVEAQSQGLIVHKLP